MRIAYVFRALLEFFNMKQVKHVCSTWRYNIVETKYLQFSLLLHAIVIPYKSVLLWSTNSLSLSYELGPRDRPRAAPEHGKHCLLTSFSRPYRSINHTVQADISFHCSMSLCVAIGYTSCVFIWNALDDSDNTLWLFSPSNRHPCYQNTKISLYVAVPGWVQVWSSWESKPRLKGLAVGAKFAAGLDRHNDNCEFHG